MCFTFYSFALFSLFWPPKLHRVAIEQYIYIYIYIFPFILFYYLYLPFFCNFIKIKIIKKNLLAFRCGEPVWKSTLFAPSILTAAITLRKISLQFSSRLSGILRRVCFLFQCNFLALSFLLWQLTLQIGVVHSPLQVQLTEACFVRPVV